jgi:hypothetical protein
MSTVIGQSHTSSPSAQWPSSTAVAETAYRTARRWQSVNVSRTRSFELAQRIVVSLGLAAALAALGRYLETLEHPRVDFGWFAYAPLSSSDPAPFHPLSPAVHLAIWGGISLVWALASVALLRGYALGRRLVLTVAFAGVLTALGSYLVTLGDAANRPGLQFLSSEQTAQYGSPLDPWVQLLIWVGLAVVWTIGAVLLLRTQPSKAPNPAGP